MNLKVIWEMSVKVMSPLVSTAKNLLRPYYRPVKTIMEAGYEYYFDAGSREPHGGPLNNQAHRQKMVKEILRLIEFQNILETGTHYGSSTNYFRNIFQGPVHSVEINPHYFWYNKFRFLNKREVKIWKSNSVDFLKKISKDRRCYSVPTFFYLDAHWHDYLPLRGELETIFAHWPDSVVMIDDFRVEEDPDYAYDDYGPGKVLSLDYLRSLRKFEFAIFFPSIPALEETGKRRGSVVLTSTPGYAEVLKSAESLRFFGTSKSLRAP